MPDVIFFISGSAVVSNLEKNGKWQKELAGIHTKYKRLLDEEKTKLLVAECDLTCIT
jgi:hypothetical protein